MFIYPVIFLLVTTLFSCNDTPEDIPNENNSEIEYKELTPEEAKLKTELAEAAKIIAEIASDKEVLDEIVGTIKVQPRVMEDRVKFAELMNSTQKLKSASVNFKQGKFAKAFNSKLSKGEFKSTSTLIDNLEANGVEVYIPYPIEDYPEGTEIVVTSTPLDNEFENIGYYLGNIDKTVIANQELTDVLPVIIVTPSVVGEDEILKSLSLDCQENNYKSATSIDPISVWDNTAYTFTIYIDYLYILNDYVEGLFQTEAQIHYCSGGLSFDSSNSSIKNISTSEENHSSVRFPRKYEGYARDGYVKGMFPIMQRHILDWHPGISSISFGFFADLPKRTNTESTTLSAAFKAEMKVPLPPLDLLLKPEGGISNTVSKSIEAGDKLYDNKVWPRYSYKQLYNVSDTWSSVHGSGWVEVSSGFWRPVRKATNELFYVTHCEVGTR